jgi:hypothetical protein
MYNYHFTWSTNTDYTAREGGYGFKCSVGWIINSGVANNRFPRKAVRLKSGYRLKFKKAVVFRFDGVFGRRLYIFRISEFQGGVHSCLGLLICDAVCLAFKMLPSTDKATRGHNA